MQCFENVLFSLKIFRRDKLENMTLGSDETALHRQTVIVINLILLLEYL